jgi:hypothetical protein
MLSTRWRFIFLHAPKTGGNAMQLLLQPHSDDRLTGLDRGPGRFGVQGPHTRDKHATLQDYSDSLGGDLSGWRVALTARDPFERAVSTYFSPHRWARADADGGPGTPVWSRKAFLKLLGQMPSLADFMTVDGEVRRPDHLIRQEHLAEDFAAFVQAAGIPLDISALQTVNRSSAEPEQRLQALADPAAQNAARLRFAADYELLKQWA